jgi:hypothetical protein
VDGGAYFSCINDDICSWTHARTVKTLLGETSAADRSTQ